MILDFFFGAHFRLATSGMVTLRKKQLLVTLYIRSGCIVGHVVNLVIITLNTVGLTWIQCVHY